MDLDKVIRDTQNTLNEIIESTYSLCRNEEEKRRIIMTLCNICDILLTGKVRLLRIRDEEAQNEQ